jgi:hypothetical protein
VNRRNFMKMAVAATATGLLLPERKFWQLDQTMLTPKPFIPFETQELWQQHFIVEGEERILSDSKWTIVRQGPDATGYPAERIMGYRADVPGSGFTIMIDAAMKTIEQWNGQYEAIIGDEIKKNIRAQEYQIATIGKAGPPTYIVPGSGQTIAYSEAFPDITTDPALWPEWWT